MSVKHVFWMRKYLLGRKMIITDKRIFCVRAVYRFKCKKPVLDSGCAPEEHFSSERLEILCFLIQKNVIPASDLWNISHPGIHIYVYICKIWMEKLLLGKQRFAENFTAKIFILHVFKNYILKFKNLIDLHLKKSSI